MLRHQDAVTISEDAMAAGIGAARWPARLQRLDDGPLTQGRLIWLDGGHNRSAGQALADHFQGRKVHLIIGMLEAKDPAALVDPLSAMIASTTVVPVPGHDWHGIDAFPQGSQRAEDVPAALKALPDDGLPVLIAGSLYLAGEVLRLNDELPD